MLSIGLFLEDLAQAEFAHAFIDKVFSQCGIAPYEMHIRNARGGKTRVYSQFRDYLKDYQGFAAVGYDLTIAMIDTDCESPPAHVVKLQRIQADCGYVSPVIYATPHPYVEAWYLADPSGVQRVAGCPATPFVPIGECNSTLYKEALINAFIAGGVVPTAGGVEYAADIVQAMNLYTATRTLPELDQFVGELRTFCANNPAA